MAAEPTSDADLAPAPGQRFHGALPRFGTPIADFLYTDLAGDPFLHVCRYTVPEDEPTEGDQPIITKWWVWNPNLHGWVHHKGAPIDLPLYQAHRIITHPGALLYITDTEESAVHLQALMDAAETPAVATCWPGGLPAVKRQDWELVFEHDCILWMAQEKTMSTLVGRIWNGCQSNGRDVHIMRGGMHSLSTFNTWEQVVDHSGEHLLAVPSGQIVVPQSIEVPAEAPEPAQVSVPRSLLEKWNAADLATTSNGVPHHNMHNVCRIIEYHKGGYGDVWIDEFHNRIMTHPGGDVRPREWREADTLELTRLIQDPKGWGLHKMTSRTVHEGVQLAASKRRRNEVREWLESLEWDQRERLDAVLIDGWGVANNEYHAAVGRCFLIGAVARIMRPGCQLDSLPVFEGPEGIRKTSALVALAGEEWFDNPSYALGDHDFYQALAGKWILEFAELANLNGRTGDQLKAIVTRRVDVYRPSYGRMTMEFPRMCVFSATTNRYDWNNSDTGARRFWPILCGRINVAWIKDNRAQLFAEAMRRYQDGEDWHSVSPSLAQAAQDERIPIDVWHGPIEYYVSHAREVTTEEILQSTLEITDKSKWNHAAKIRIAQVLRLLGFVQKVAKVGTRSQRVWTRRTPLPLAGALPLEPE